MPTLELTLLLKQDGLPVPGFPLVRRVVVDSVQEFNYQKATGGGDVAFPTNQITTLHVLLAQSLNQTTTVKLPSIALAAGGLIVVFDGVPATSTIANASGSPTTTLGVGGGT